MNDNINEYKNKSEFYHFGLLPEICIHSLDEDEYSKMYTPNETCEACGGKEWIESTMRILDLPEKLYPAKRVQKCKDCESVRIAHHIGIKD